MPAIALPPEPLKLTRRYRVEILWPSGQRDVYRDLDPDRFYVVTEGRGYGPDERLRVARAP